ncbi:MAG: VOC family protein [Chloroflexota bacterium]|nr:MAG: glyoxalase [Chloroflexota bacterium]
MFGEARVMAVIPALDLARARAFYAEKLGLAPVVEDPDEGLLYLLADGSRFLLYETPYAGTAEHTIASFAVDDLDEVMRFLRSRGVVFEEYDTPNLKTTNGVAVMGSHRGAWFKDSEGNILNIAQLSGNFPR